MNICIIGQYPPTVGGVATYTKNLEDTLKKMGHNVYILTYKQPTIPKSDNIFYTNNLQQPLLRAVSFIVSGYFMLNKIIDKYDIDIVHANYLMPPGLIAALNKKNVKIIQTAHGSDINILSKNKITKPIIRYILKNSDEVYFVSEKLKKQALELNIPGLDEKSYITENSVNTDKFKPINDTEKILKKKYEKPIVMFIGNLVKQKGLKYLLNAKKQSKTNYTLLIYGDGSQKEELQAKIEDEQIPDVHLMGKTSTPETIIPESDIMVLPSISEGASIIALESMACAKPLISTDTGNIRNLITTNENGIIIPPKDPEKLAEAIDTLVNDENKREKLGKQARKQVIENYSQMKIPYLEKK